MAYLVTYGTSTLFEPANDELAIHDAKISQSANGYSTFDFTLPPEHPLIGSMSIHDAANPVVVTFDGVELFTGVITSITRTLWNEYEVRCASELVYLDWVVTRYKPSDNRPGTALAELIALYNAYVELTYGEGRATYEMAVDPQSLADSVGYNDPTTGNKACDAEASSPTSILSILMGSIVNEYGAFIRLRRDSLGNRLVGIFPTPPDANSQTVRLGENLLDYNYSESDDDFFTGCYPVGGTADELESASEGALVVAEANALNARKLKLRAQSGSVSVVQDGIIIVGHSAFLLESGSITITTTAREVAVNPAIPYVIPAGTAVRYVGLNPTYYDGTVTLDRLPSHMMTGAYDNDMGIVWHRQAATRYGLKVMTFHDSDVKDARTLMNKAIAVLGANIEPKRNLSVSAVDMAFYASGYQHLQAGQTVRVISEPHGLDLNMYVMSADINMQDPSQTRYQLGTMQNTLSRSLMRTKKDVRDTDDNMITELNDTITSSYIGGLR